MNALLAGLTRDELAVWDIAATVVDPEVPVLTIEDLGVLRSVSVDEGTVTVDITPTYSGCPAIDAMWPYVDELFREDPYAGAAGDGAVDPRTLRAAFDATVPRLIVEAGLAVPAVPPARGGGRSGVHAEEFGPMLAEMQVLARAHPGATW